MINELFFAPLINECVKRNDTVEKYINSDISLRQHLSDIIAVSKKNGSITFRKGTDAVLDAAEEYAEKRFGKNVAFKVREALQLRIINTADHKCKRRDNSTKRCPIHLSCSDYRISA